MLTKEEHDAMELWLAEFVNHNNDLFIKARDTMSFQSFICATVRALYIIARGMGNLPHGEIKHVLQFFTDDDMCEAYDGYYNRNVVHINSDKDTIKAVRIVDKDVPKGEN